MRTLVAHCKTEETILRYKNNFCHNQLNHHFSLNVSDTVRMAKLGDRLKLLTVVNADSNLMLVKVCKIYSDPCQYCFLKGFVVKVIIYNILFINML